MTIPESPVGRARGQWRLGLLMNGLHSAGGAWMRPTTRFAAGVGEPPRRTALISSATGGSGRLGWSRDVASP